MKASSKNIFNDETICEKLFVWKSITCKSVQQLKNGGFLQQFSFIIEINFSARYSTEFEQ